MSNEKVQGMMISYAGNSLFNSLRRKTVKISSFKSLEQVKYCLKEQTPVQVFFERNDAGFKTRMIPFIQGMSAYFGATAQVVGC